MFYVRIPRNRLMFSIGLEMLMKRKLYTILSFWQISVIAILLEKSKQITLNLKWIKRIDCEVYK